MQTSPSIAAIAAALAKAQKVIKPAVFDRTNPHFKNKYATLPSIVEAIRSALADNGIAVLQGAEADGAQVKVTTMLAHSSGEWLSSTLTLTATQNTPQGVGSALTYGRRFGLSSMVCAVADEDDDGEQASTPPKPKAPPATVTPITKGSTVPAAPRSIDERKRDLAAELTSLGFAAEGIKVFVKDAIGHDKASTPEDMDKLEAAAALVRARHAADKDADLAY